MASTVREQARRYMEAVHGPDVWFRAPETFSNMLERWVWAVASEAELSIGEQSMKDIEARMAQLRAEG